ncbi:FAD-binding oxidoreductase [Puia sp.]|jgi:glycine/D-amino acid oxidase-like deaminating enzyme|uniref:NAD(P)/FAD-dependent oxidoreductase n=1 Tax=Puia sp. TaxID=2045100 RepID=UPI002F42C2FB
MGRQVELLIIGAGICGSFLHLELERAGLSHLVIDEGSPFAASRVAAGLINPVTGRRLVTTWIIDELLGFAREAYDRAAEELGARFFSPATVVDYFPTAQMRLAFLKRLEEGGAYLRLPDDERDWLDRFYYELGYGLIGPCYLVDVPALLEACRQRMKTRGRVLEERFESAELRVDEEGVRYRDIEARRIVFCDGAAGFDNPWFSRLPFAPNKGEALIVEIPGWKDRPAGAGEALVFKKGISLVPWRENLYWAGSSYEWSFEHAQPTELFRARTEAALRDWLKEPFRTVEHWAAVRPATLERRPFVGFHPGSPAVGILNGMGTKGCSLAPYFAHELVQNVLTGRPIRADADVKRFTKVLTRK